MKPNAPLRVGIIGAGRVSHIHARGFDRLDSTRIVAVADPRHEAAASLAEQYGAEVETDYVSLLARPDITAVVIAAPHDLHFPIALAALSAGKHVFMDKPLALTSAQGVRLVDAASESGLCFMLCHNLLFHEAVRSAGDFVKSGVVGRVTTAEGWSVGWLDISPWDFRLSREVTGGGAWFDNGPHLLYVLEDWLGPIDDIYALAARGESRIGGEDSAAAIHRHRCGAVATTRISYSERRPGQDLPWPGGWSMGFEVHGTSGSVRCDVVPTPMVTVYDGLSAPQSIAIDCTFEDAFAAAIEEFVEASLKDRAPAVTGRDSLRILDLIERAYQP